MLGIVAAKPHPVGVAVALLYRSMGLSTLAVSDFGQINLSNDHLHFLTKTELVFVGALVII